MEVAFHSNKCALKDSLRILRIAKNPCWKRRKNLFTYSDGLIQSNKNIITLHAGISKYEQNEFIKLEKQFIRLANEIVSTEEECSVCRKNCLENQMDSKNVEEELDKTEQEASNYTTDDISPIDREKWKLADDAIPTVSAVPRIPTNLPLNEPLCEMMCEDEIVAHENNKSIRTSKIEQAADAMKRISHKTDYIQSVINMHKEELDKLSYNSAASLEYSETHLLELDEIIRRRKRAFFIKKWLGGIFVFLCFISLLFLRPFLS